MTHHRTKKKKVRARAPWMGKTPKLSLCHHTPSTTFVVWIWARLVCVESDDPPRIAHDVGPAPIASVQPYVCTKTREDRLSPLLSSRVVRRGAAATSLLPVATKKKKNKKKSRRNSKATAAVLPPSFFSYLTFFFILPRFDPCPSRHVRGARAPPSTHHSASIDPKR